MPRRVLLLLVALLVAAFQAALFGPWVIGKIAESRLASTARARGLTAEWDRAEGAWPARVRFRHLRIRRAATGDTLLAADSLAVAIDPGSLLTLHPRAASVEMSRAALHLLSSHAGPDTLAIEDEAQSRAIDKGA